MKNISSNTLILFLTISLAGIIGLQIYLFQNSIKVKEAQFNHDALSALQSISNRLERVDAKKFMDQSFTFQPFISSRVDCTVETNMGLNTKESKSYTKDTIIQFQNGQAQLSISQQINPGIQKDIHFVSEGSAEKAIYNRANLMDSMLNNMMVYSIRNILPIAQRFSKDEIDSVIKTELNHHNIKTNYEYAIAESGYLTNLQSNKFTASSIDFKIPVFRDDFYSRPKYLLMSFPNKSGYVLQSMWFTVLLSLLFAATIIATFWKTIVQMQNQKRESQIKTDFINNMTHEFKTPIATINLAIDAMNSPNVKLSNERLNHYSGIIKQENKRMFSQVEKVLNIAMLDNKELELDLEEIYLNELLEDAIGHVALQIENRGGKINLALCDEEINIRGDATHIENIFVNILDNANKYSPEYPEITVKSYKDEKWAFIEITDSGMGMSSDVKNQIFDRFYRQETGNIHNVKGHGLGLSYVFEMVKLHGGTVEVNSKEGIGSTFIVKLLLYEPEAR